MADCSIAHMKTPAWTRYWLRAAAVLNVGWGVSMILAPTWFFDLFGLLTPSYPVVLQGLGLIVAVFGVGYWIASANPAKHWLIVFVGLVAKILAPVGFVWTALSGDLPWAAGSVMIGTDLIWWLPFAAILYFAAKANQFVAEPLKKGDSLYSALGEIRVASGKTIESLSYDSPVLLVFLRHFGCVFCKESLSHIRKQKDQIEADGTKIVFVHMGSIERGEAYFESYGFENFEQVSDRGQRLYQLFKFSRATIGQIMGPSVVWAGLKASFDGHFNGAVEGDGFQLPGLALVTHGMVVKVHRYKTAAEIPDYVKLANCPMPDCDNAAATPPCIHAKESKKAKPSQQ